MDRKLLWGHELLSSVTLLAESVSLCQRAFPCACCSWQASQHSQSLGDFSEAAKGKAPYPTWNLTALSRGSCSPDQAQSSADSWEGSHAGRFIGTHLFIILGEPPHPLYTHTHTIFCSQFATDTSGENHLLFIP